MPIANRIGALRGRDNKHSILWQGGLPLSGHPLDDPAGRRVFCCAKYAGV